MNIVKIEQVDVTLPFLRPFQTSYGQITDKQTSLYIVHDASGAIGLGELDALVHPDYIEETLDSARVIIREYLIPTLLGVDWQHPREVSTLFRGIQGYGMAKAALETAAWDSYARYHQRSLTSLIGGTTQPVAVGVSLGIESDFTTLVEQVADYVQQGYTRIKLKIKPGYDFAPLAAIRQAFPDLLLMADANSAYDTLPEREWTIFQQLDTLNLAMIEQPFGPRDFVKHARLQAQLRTPLCLDENIRSVSDVQTAVALGSCRAVNLKIPRVGGLSEALAICQFCHQNKVRVWLGGMYEAGVGRALNVQVAALPTLTFPGDLSASNRYFAEDIVTPVATLQQGKLAVLDEPGIGVHLDWTTIARYQQGYHLYE